ncbi:MAG: GNAT family N-acetyltransferase [Chitinivibrionales bacterium]|nr:GNAT family N-acetyltransferase [Chitinivibrionales bacterium]
METVRITQVHERDCRQIVEFHTLTYKLERELYSPDALIPSAPQSLEETKKEIREKIFLKATVEDKIVGTIRAYEFHAICYIGKIIVHPVFQNQVLYSRLVSAVELMFNHISRFELITEDRNIKGICSFERMGYTVLKEKKINKYLNTIYLEKICT